MVSLVPSEFRDPVHGFIAIYPHERQIIDTPEFQRLRRVHQLGLTHYVYHGAAHSRFGHSIGVMNLAGRATTNLIIKNRELIQERLNWEPGEIGTKTQELVLLARLAGLLHDVGHGPFSHSAEESLFVEKTRHEAYSSKIILETHVGGIIDSQCGELNITKEMVSELITGTATLPAGFVPELIASSFDVDKMDYLLRDSYYCGVQYGRFDLDRIMDTLTLDSQQEDGSLRIAIENDGFHALEEFVLARYFMFTQVYFHDVRRAFDLILGEFISELLIQNYGVGKYPIDLDEYLSWDDNKIFSEAAARRDINTKNLAWRICDRNHPKVVYQTTPSPDPGIARQVSGLTEAAHQEFPSIHFWLDKAVDHPERFRQQQIMIKYPGNPTVFRSFQRESRPLSGLEEIGQVRLYADVRDDHLLENQVTDFCRRFMG